MEEILKALVLVFGLVLAAAPAVAQTIKPADARTHVGQTVTVEGVVSGVHVASGNGMTFIDMGGRYPGNAFAAVIFRDDAGKFPNVAALNGKTVDVTGAVKLYKGKAEIILNSAAQLKRK
jgi:DNA/RNA endonuclease YhcR with UshA esterase domain